MEVSTGNYFSITLHYITFLVFHRGIYTIIVDTKHMWQSRVEIESYSVTYFDRIAVFEVPYQ